MKSATPAPAELRGNLIVSCQAQEGSPFAHPPRMARFARAAVEGGAAGIRANGREDIRAIPEVADPRRVGRAVGRRSNRKCEFGYGNSHYPA
jgi:N-acylglucosamine-6-phosphate 2-epimerase